MLAKGDRVKIKTDWLPKEAKKCVAVVDNFQKCGTIQYVKVKWLGKNAEAITEDCGVLFSEDEIVLL